MDRRTLIILLLLTFVFTAPSLRKIPFMLQFTNTDVRAAAPKAIAALRKEGVWVVGTTLNAIRQEQNRTCFEWSYVYRSRTQTKPADYLSTCIE